MCLWCGGNTKRQQQHGGGPHLIRRASLLSQRTLCTSCASCSMARRGWARWTVWEEGGEPTHLTLQTRPRTAPSYDDPSGASVPSSSPQHRTRFTTSHRGYLYCVCRGRTTTSRATRTRLCILNTPRLVDVVTPYEVRTSREASVDEGHRHLDLLEMHQKSPPPISMLSMTTSFVPG